MRLKTWCLLTLLAMSAALSAQTTPLHAVHFSSGSDAFTPSAQAELQQALWQLKPGQRLLLAGHTDAEGTAAFNNDLSLRRTQAVQAFCQSQGLHVEVAEHHGESAPVASNTTEEGRAANRRVDVCLLTSDPREPNNAGGDAQTLEAFAQAVRPLTQTFRFVPERDTALLCQNGSILYVPQGAFEGAFDGMMVKLEVTEALSKADMVLAALNTQSGDKMLESGGMIQVRAFQGKRELSLKDNKRLDVFLPSGGDLEGMQVFYADDHMNWGVDNTQTVRNFQAGNMYRFEEYYYDRMTVERCRFFSCRLPRLWSRELSDRQTIPGMRRNQQVVRRQERRTFRMLNPSLTEVYGVGTMEEVAELVAREKEVEGDMFAAFSVSQLGWINCDRFYEVERKTQLICYSDLPQPTYNYLVFEDINSIMPAQGLQGRAFFGGIPEGATAKLVSMRVVDGQSQLALTDVVLGKEPDVNLEYNDISEQALRQELQAYLNP